MVKITGRVESRGLGGWHPRWHRASSIGSVKLSISLSDDEVAFIDRCIARDLADSRSAVIQQALARLHTDTLTDAYASAWDEWSSADGELWDETVTDGVE